MANKLLFVFHAFWVFFVKRLPNFNVSLLFAEAALNLFINSNSQELLKEMKPDLKKKLLLLMRNFVENLFQKIPYDAWLV